MSKMSELSIERQNGQNGADCGGSGEVPAEGHYVIFNETDGIESGSGQTFETKEDAKAWIEGERKKHMELPPVGKYKTSGGEYISPYDVAYSISYVEPLPFDDEDYYPPAFVPKPVIEHDGEKVTNDITLIIDDDEKGHTMQAKASVVRYGNIGITLIAKVDNDRMIAEKALEKMLEGIQFKINADHDANFAKEYFGRNVDGGDYTVWDTMKKWLVRYMKGARDNNE